jgi:hypothetical protein
MALPATLKCEAKLTTGTGVQVARRELQALASNEPGTVGVLAVLFLCGDREVDGRWLLVDASQLRAPHGDTLSMTRTRVVAAARGSASLGALRRHVDERWAPFLQAFREEALGGHGPLVAELARCHAERRIEKRLPPHRVLDVEHRSALEQLVARHGESGAGRVLQDLLAYLLAFAGYDQVTNNPVGVPDFVLSGVERRGEDRVAVELSRAEVDRLLALCNTAGEHGLATSLALQSAHARSVPREPVT